MVTSSQSNAESQTSLQKINFMSICDMVDSNTNKISIDRYHIEIMGDLAGAALLTQLRYWFSPTTKSAIKGQTRVGIKREGKLWLAKSDNEWWDECYVTPKQVRRIKAQLVKLGIVEIKTFKFKGAPTVHYHLDLEKYAELYHNQRLKHYEKIIHEQEKEAVNKDLPRDSAQRAKSILPKGQNGSCPKGQIYNISSKHLISAYHFKEHMENVFRIQNGQDREMLPKLTGSVLKQFKSLDSERQRSYYALVSLPPAEPGGQGFNPVQAIKLASIYTPEEIEDALKVLEEHIAEGTSVSSPGGYVSKLLEKGLKPAKVRSSKNIEENDAFIKSYKKTGHHVSRRKNYILIKYPGGAVAEIDLNLAPGDFQRLVREKLAQ